MQQNKNTIYLTIKHHMETGIGERVVGGIVAFVVLFFCAYFIGQALDGLEPHTAEQAPSPLLDYRTIGDSI